MQPTNQEIKELSKLVQRQRDLEKEISQLEAQLKARNTHLEQVSKTDIPDLMGQLGISSITLEDGSKVVVEKIYAAHISVEHQEEAYQWLRDNGHEGLIKSLLQINFGRLELAQMQALATELQQRGLALESKKSIHHNTLKAFVKEQIENAKPIPHDTFGIFVGSQSKIV